MEDAAAGDPARPGEGARRYYNERQEAETMRITITYCAA